VEVKRCREDGVHGPPDPYWWHRRYIGPNNAINCDQMKMSISLEGGEYTKSHPMFKFDEIQAAGGGIRYL